MNWEISTKNLNLVTFKRWDCFKDEKFLGGSMGGSLKNLVFRGGEVHEKAIYREGDCLKKGVGFDSFQI